MSQLFSTVGQSCVRIDALAKVKGEARYTADLALPGMLVGKILFSPYPHAGITELDTACARGLPGVKAVVTAQDTPLVKFGLYHKDEMVLAASKTRYVGDEVAAVAAADEDTADAALKLLKVSYEQLPAIFEVSEALKPGAVQVHEEFPGNLAQRYTITRGDIDKAFLASHCIIEETFQTQYVSQVSMEPTTCIADVDSKGRLTVWAPCQAPFELRSLIAEVLRLPPAKIRVIQPYVGGGFGSRHRSKTAVITALLALQAQRPVKITLTREEEFITSRPRVPAVIRLKMGFAQDGKILAKATEIIADNGAYTDIVPRLLETMARRIDSLYTIDNILTNVRLVYTNKAPTGAYRGFGNPQMTFALESLLDMAATKLKISPVTIRLRNAVEQGRVSAHGWQISSCALKDCIQQVGMDLEHGAQPGSQSAPADARSFGRGMGNMIHVAGRKNVPDFAGSTAWVRVQDTGKVIVYSGEADVGQGSSTVFAQIAAEVLELPLEVIEVAPLDTDNCPYAAGSFSDRVTILGGNAVRLAAADAKRQLLGVAAQYWGVNREQVVYERGTVKTEPAGQDLGIFELLCRYGEKNGETPVWGIGKYDPPAVMRDPETKYGNIAAAYTFASQMAEIGVDRETGQIDVVGFNCAHDVGRAINPQATQGQIEGALAQGVGYALTEEWLLEKGYMMNGSMLEYKVPTVLDMVRPRVTIFESVEPNGPFGAKGAGEPGLVPTAAAIANALFQATGRRLTSLPLTPAKVLEALGK